MDHAKGLVHKNATNLIFDLSADYHLRMATMGDIYNRKRQPGRLPLSISDNQ